VISAPPRHESAPNEAPTAPVVSQALTLLARTKQWPYGLSLILLTLTLSAGAIRLHGLAGPDGSLNTDEARLTLAADGVLRTGLPVMPSGRIYTRGLLNGYVIAGSFALMGRNDFAARLPSVLAGALLVPVVFLLGRALGGTAAGLAAAVFAALAEPLVYYSRSAWLPSIFLLLFTLAVYCCYRGFVQRRGAWQVAGAGVFCLALLSYEFAVLLLGGLGIYLGVEAARGRLDWYRGRPTLLSLVMLLAGLLLLGALGLALRAGTLAGPLGEARAWFTPRLALNGMSYYLRVLVPDYTVLIGAGFVGLLLLAAAPRKGVVFVLALLVLAFLIPSFVTQLQRSPRYVLPMLPLLAVLAAAGTVRMARLVGRGLRLGGVLRAALPGMALVVVFEVALWGDAAAATALLRQPAPGQTWVQAILDQGLEPSDLLVAESANKAQYYFGRSEFFIRPLNYDRYAYPESDMLRDVSTGAVLLVGRGDFERLVETPNQGRSAWIIGREVPLRSTLQNLDPELWPSLVSSAERLIRTTDGWVLLKVKLPRGAGAPAT
jgi:4-amino-4-deoxy-L-arabinose transferase-like glycosyltransferase